jgi:hypothetical protein
VDGHLAAVVLGRGDRPLARVEDDLGELLRLILDSGDQLRIGLDGWVRVVLLRDQGLARQPDHHDEHDEGDERAAEKTIHWDSFAAG